MKNLKKRMISNILTFLMLFMMFLNTFAYAAGDTIDSVLVEIVNILLVVAGILCLGKLIQIGIKFLLAPAEEKSNAKMAVLPWLIGTIVCFGADWIGLAVINLISKDMPSNVLDY